MSLSHRLLEVYQRLLSHYGPQGWWPRVESFGPPQADQDKSFVLPEGRTRAGPFEIMVGAILTQNTAWPNVEKAICNLKSAGPLTSALIRSLPLEELARLIYPSGYYNGKARHLKAMAQRLKEGYGDDLGKLFSLKTHDLRKELMSINGIGPETADAIMLYAAKKPVFVIDAYTKRIMGRLGLQPQEPALIPQGGAKVDSYGAYQRLFMDNLIHDVSFFNEFHALLVRHAKVTCRNDPLCSQCPILSLCPFAHLPQPQVLR